MEFQQNLLYVDLDAIRENFRAVKQKANTAALAVVKADAYGLGALPVAKALEQDAAFFGVANVPEALELRRFGFQKPILILGRIPQSAYEVAVREELRHPLFRWEDALALSQEAVRQGKTALVHIAVDTGMSRIGMVPTRESAQLCLQMAKLPGLCIEGLFTHYATADCPDLTQARCQAERFAEFDNMLREGGLSVPVRHANNSAGVINLDTGYEMVRPGIVTFGMYPDEGMEQKLRLRSALRWESRVAYVKTVPENTPVSYGATFVTQRPTVIATLPFGYADGYLRSMSGKAWVLIRGKRAPVLGKICMDQLMVDVTDIPGVEVDDPVTVIGTDGQERISVEMLAEMAGSFHYEFICGLSKRLHRLYRLEGQILTAAQVMEK